MKQQLQDYLAREIPLTQALGAMVLRADAAGVEVAAPLAPNVNHCGTVFGGSANAVALLAAWGWLHARLQLAGLAGTIVVAKSEMQYFKPIDGDFQARTLPLDEAAWQRLFAALKRGRRARLHVTVELHCGGEALARLEGEFAVLPERSA